VVLTIMVSGIETVTDGVGVITIVVGCCCCCCDSGGGVSVDSVDPNIMGRLGVNIALGSGVDSIVEMYRHLPPF